MFQKIIAFFMAIFAFIAGLFGGGKGNDTDKSYVNMNMSYGTEERQSLDLYLPKNAEGSSCGLMVFIHGGGWISGDKSECKEETLKYASEELNIAMATINYRYASEKVTANDILDDIASALSAIKTKAAENGLNIDRAILQGGSAGGHLSMLYAYTRNKTSPIKISAIVELAGPSDLTNPGFYTNNDLGDGIYYIESLLTGKNITKDNLNENLSSLQAISPINYVTKDSPATLIAHGKVDKTVPFANSVALDEKLTSVGVKHDFVVFNNSGHDLSNDPDSSKQLNTLLFEYAAEYLK